MNILVLLFLLGLALLVGMAIASALNSPKKEEPQIEQDDKEEDFEEEF